MTNLDTSRLAEQIARNHLAGRFVALPAGKWAEWDGQRWHLTASSDAARLAVTLALRAIHHDEERAAYRWLREVLTTPGLTDNEAHHAVSAQKARLRQLDELLTYKKLAGVTRAAREHLSVDAAPPLQCAACHRTIGKTSGAHNPTKDNRVVCFRCLSNRRGLHAELWPNCDEPDHDTHAHLHTVGAPREECAALLGLWPPKPNAEIGAIA